MRYQSSTLALALLTLTALPIATVAPKEDRRAAPPATGFAASVTIGDGEIFIGRTGGGQPGSIYPAPGGIHLFQRNAQGGWTDAEHITGVDVDVYDSFGAAMAVDGNTLLVGAPTQNDGRGAVRVLQRTPEGWTQTTTLTAIDHAAVRGFGSAVILNGGLAIVGALPAEGNGAVFVFRRDGANWSQLSRLMGQNADENDRFGTALAVSRGRLFVGAPGADDDRGAVYVFQNFDSPSGTTVETILRPSEGEGNQFFGANLSVVDDVALVGAPARNDNSGAVFVFGRDAAGTWDADTTLSLSDRADDAAFGAALAFDGRRAWIGAPGAANGRGAVYMIAQNETGGWIRDGMLTPSELGPGSAFGSSIALSDGVAVVAAGNADMRIGAAVVFERNASGEWRETSLLREPARDLQAMVDGEAACTDGSTGPFDCNEIDLVAFLPAASVGVKPGVIINDVWGWTDPETGKEYVLLGRSDAAAFVDISDPVNPVYLGHLPRTEGAIANLWRDIKVYKDHAFIVADGAGAHGMQVFDLTQLRDVRMPPVTFSETAHYDGIASAHNIVINEETGMAYAVGNSMGGETCGGGLHMIDIRNPTNPTFAGCFSDPTTGRQGTGYTHDAQCVIYRGPDEDHQGKEICFGANEIALSIADVTDKENPVPIARAEYPNVGYTHQGWLTEDHRYFFMGDEGDEIEGNINGTRTLIWDVIDLDDPVLFKEYFANTKAIDHNQYVKGNFVYQANLLSGLRILDISDIENPVEVGFFDTVPYDDDLTGFGGAWSNYPFFESGVIVVSSWAEGLFLLKKREKPVL